MFRLETTPLDIRRDDPTSVTDSSLDAEPSAREKFLLDEGMEMLARYRAISDPGVRLLIRQMIAVIADGRTPGQ